MTKSAGNQKLVSNLTTTELIKNFKRMISRSDKPKIIYSDNTKTFKAGEKQLVNINKDQKPCDFLRSEMIMWQFNVPRAPWLGGQFERLISLIKENLYRTIEKAQLAWAELEEVLPKY